MITHTAFFTTCITFGMFTDNFPLTFLDNVSTLAATPNNTFLPVYALQHLVSTSRNLCRPFSLLA